MENEKQVKIESTLFEMADVVVSNMGGGEKRLSCADENDVLIPPETDLNDVGKIPKPPIWGLPKIHQRMITNGAYVYGVPIDFFLIYILAAVGAAIRKKAVLIDKYKNFPQLWFVAVAPSGVGKSEPLKIAFAPLDKRDAESYQVNERDIVQWKKECAEAKKREEVAPSYPTLKQVLITDTTPEGLFRALSINGGLCVRRDELNGFFKDIGRYSKSGEIEHYLSSFNNDSLRINRKGEDPSLINDPYLSMVGSIQPMVLKDTLLSQGLIDNGMLARFAFAFPDNQEKPNYRDTQMSPDLLKEYEEHIYALCETTKIETKFDADAKVEYIKFSDELTARINKEEDDHIRAMLSKMEIFLCRLALMIYCSKLIAGETDEATIDVETVQYCIELCRYFIATGEKVYGLKSASKTKLFQKPITKNETMKLFAEIFTIKNKTQFAKSIGMQRQAVDNLLNN